MAHEKAKVYYDGNHYIAIPRTESPTTKKSGGKYYSYETEEMKQIVETELKGIRSKKKQERKATELVEALKTNFESEEKAAEFVTAELERINRNYIVRLTRLKRKVNLGNWNYFCTFTYDDKKQTEDSFKEKLRNCFKKMSYRKGWIYIGVWERSPKNNRLHFHGLFNIPENAMVGDLTEHRDYSTKAHKMQTMLQNSYFTERFGRNDFEPIKKNRFGNATAYLMKYIGKSDERIVYSKNTPAYFISDILDEDVACTVGQEDKKLVLFDNFSCFDNGVYMGEVSPEVIKQMPKSN